MQTQSVTTAVSRDSPVSQSLGGVELREDLPLKAGVGSSDATDGCMAAGGPRMIIACFTVLTLAVTIALFTQIHYGDYQIVPHGSVSSSAAACSSAGTDALKVGGRALDAAAVTALCLALLAPHRTSLDASGSLVYWEYRNLRTKNPVLMEWGGKETASGTVVSSSERPPRMLVALAALHAQYGVLPWPRLLQPTIDLARKGFIVSENLASVAAASAFTFDETMTPGAIHYEPQLADYLESLQFNSSAQLVAAWSSYVRVRTTAPLTAVAGKWRIYAGGPGTDIALTALAEALQIAPTNSDDIFNRIIAELQKAAVDGEWPPGGVSSGLAVVDHLDTYIALVTGLSVPFGSEPKTTDGWKPDAPTAPIDLAPAIAVDEHVCGTRYVIGAESSGALAQGIATIIAAGSVNAVEQPRVEELWDWKMDGPRFPLLFPSSPPFLLPQLLPRMPRSTSCSSVETRCSRTPTVAAEDSLLDFNSNEPKV